MPVTPISPLAALPTVLVSGLLLALMIVRLGRGKLAATLFRAAFSVGVVMGTLVLIAEAPFELKADPHRFSFVTRAFGFAGFAEEAAKFAGVYLFVRGHWLRREPRDLVLGAAAVALGFALFEDVLYIAAAGPKWGTVATARAVTAIPMHVLLGIFAGYALARGEQAGSRLAGVLRVGAAWLVASLLHGFYDLALFIIDAKPPYPQSIEATAQRLNVSPLSVLLAIALCAACGVVAAAMGSIRALGRPPFATGEGEPPVIQPNWLLRLSLAPATGWLVGGALLAVAALLLALAAVLSFAADVAELSLLVALPAVFLLAIGALLARRATPRRAARRSRPALRRLGWAAAACLVALSAAAGYRWGDKPARTLIALRITVGGAQMAVKGDYEGAIREYDRALAVDPDYAEALANRAKANENLQRYDRALADLDRAVALLPKNAELLKQRADVHSEMHDLTAAIADLDQALALSPNNPQILARRAGVYSDSGDDARAANDVAQAVALAPADVDVLTAQANALVRSGEVDRARQTFDAIVAAKPDALAAYFSRGRLSLYRGDSAAAIADLQRASRGSATPYPAMWLFVARARGGVGGGGDLATQTRSWPAGAWPYPVIHQMLGEISADAVRAAASNDDERCEADFYNGEIELARQHVETAASAWRRALDECPRGFVEREGAEAELKRLAPIAPTPDAAALAKPETNVDHATVVQPPPQIAANAAPVAAVERESSKVMAAGGTLLLAHYASVDMACSSRGPVAVKVVRGPVSGVVQIAQGMGFSHFSGAYERCASVKVPGADVTYAPQASFVGSDSVKVDVIFPSGLERIETFTIAVK